MIGVDEKRPTCGISSLGSSLRRIPSARLRNNWIAAGAFGLALSLACPALGQSASIPNEIVDEPRVARGTAEDPEGPTAEQQRAAPVEIALPPAPTDQEPTQAAEECDAACQREIEDLSAQKEMARAAWAMFLATIVGVIIGGASLFLIWRTVVYAREAAQAARDAVGEAERATAAAREAVEEAQNTTRIATLSYEADVRPLLKIAINKSIVCTVAPEGIQFIASIDVANVGKGVAVDVLLNCQILSLDDWEADPALVQNALDIWGRDGEGRGFAVFPSDTALDNRHEVQDVIDANNPLSRYVGRKLALLVMASYKGIHSKDVYATTQAYFGTEVTHRIAGIVTSGTGYSQNIGPSLMPASVIVR